MLHRSLCLTSHLRQTFCREPWGILVPNHYWSSPLRQFCVAETQISTCELTSACLFRDTVATAHPGGNSDSNHSLLDELVELLLEFQTLNIEQLEELPPCEIADLPGKHQNDEVFSTEPPRVPSSDSSSPAVRKTRLGASSHRNFLALCNDYNQHSCHVYRANCFGRFLQ